MGRGSDSDASSLLFGPPRPREHAKREPQLEATRKQTLAEREQEVLEAILAELEGDTGAIELAASEPLWDPSSPRQKRFQGFIEVFSTGGQASFRAVTKHGPSNSPHAQSNVEKSSVSTNVELALEAVNKKLDAKQKGKGGRSVYVPLPPTTGHVQIARSDVIEGAARYLGRPSPYED